jgi:4-carboxymuconolactone decarboxylase
VARIPFVTPADVPESERAAYDAFVQKRGSQPDAGPYALLLHMPELAQKLESLRLCIREEHSLPQKLQELVMLTVAREMDCAYIWYAHAAAAREARVRSDIVDNIREKRALTGLSQDEQAAVDFARELLRNRKVSQPTFDRASARFGQRGTLTLTNLIACYAMLAYNMNACELEAPVHATERALPITPP